MILTVSCAPRLALKFVLTWLQGPLSNLGQTLVKRAEYHFGHRVTSMSMLPAHGAAGTDGDEEECIAVLSDTDGCLTAVIPIKERAYRRLHSVQGQIHNRRVPFASLNSKSYRTSEYESIASRPIRVLIDGNVVREFYNASVSAKRDLTRRANTSIDTVAQDLKYVDSCLDYL